MGRCVEQLCQQHLATAVLERLRTEARWAGPEAVRAPSSRQGMKVSGGSDLYATFSALVRVQTALWNAADQRLRAVHGLALTHVTVLQVVAETEDCRVQDVVDTLHITVGGASKAVDRLVAAGHASRSANPVDRRSSILRVTDAGHEVLAAVTPDVVTVLEDRLGAAISTAELAELERVLQVVREHAPAGDA